MRREERKPGRVNCVEGKGARPGERRGALRAWWESARRFFESTGPTVGPHDSPLCESLVSDPERAEISIERRKKLLRQAGEVPVDHGVASSVCATRCQRSQGIERRTNAQSPRAHASSISFNTLSSFLTCLFRSLFSPNSLPFSSPAGTSSEPARRGLTGEVVGFGEEAEE